MGNEETNEIHRRKVHGLTTSGCENVRGRRYLETDRHGVGDEV